jgi:hypothetical protein
MLGRYSTPVADARKTQRRLPHGDSMVGRGRAPTATRPPGPRVNKPPTGCHRPRQEADGPRLHRRVQPAREHPPPATAGTVLRRHPPTQPLSSRDCEACRRSALPRRGWQRPPQTPSRRPRSQLLSPVTVLKATPGVMVALGWRVAPVETWPEPGGEFRLPGCCYFRTKRLVSRRGPRGPSSMLHTLSRRHADSPDPSPGH